MGEAARSAAERRPGDPWFATPIGGGMATFAGPGSPLDKVAGAGFTGPLDEAELDLVERAFAQHRSPVQLELSCLADPSIGALLTRRGYSLVAFENVLGRALPVDEPDPIGSGITVTASGPSELPVWLDTVVTGFASPDGPVAAHDLFAREALERGINDMAASPGFTRYLARRGGEVAGGASLRTKDGIAFLSGATTLPAHRRNGVQAALLATRLRDAARAGCDLAVITTLPGSSSQHNAQRRGFELLYTRAILVRPAC